MQVENINIENDEQYLSWLHYVNKYKEVGIYSEKIQIIENLLNQYKIEEKV